MQNLYVLQVEMEKFLESDLSDPDLRKEAKECVKEFTTLLRDADSSYMGGEDVLEALQAIRDDVSVKIQKSSKIKATPTVVKTEEKKAPKKVAKKPVAKTAKKTTAKKAPAKKKK